MQCYSHLLLNYSANNNLNKIFDMFYRVIEWNLYLLLAKIIRYFLLPIMCYSWVFFVLVLMNIVFCWLCFGLRYDFCFFYMIASHNIRVCIDPYDSLLSYQADQLVVAKKSVCRGLLRTELLREVNCRMYIRLGCALLPSIRR